jgi:hypothetical protein
MEVPGRCGKVSGHKFPFRIHARISGLMSSRLEERRKVKGAAYYERKKAARRQLSEAQTDAKVDEKTRAQLTEYGY